VNTQEKISRKTRKLLTADLIFEENVKYATEYIRVLSEQIDFNDEVISDLTLIARTLEETVGVEDNLSIDTVIKRVLEENVSLNDTFASEKIIVRQLQESLNVSDSVSKKLEKVLSENLILNDSVSSLKPASEFASEVEIEKLQKAFTNITATRKAVVELEKGEVSDGSIDKF